MLSSFPKSSAGGTTPFVFLLLYIFGELVCNFSNGFELKKIRRFWHLNEFCITNFVWPF
jgi:hypothetical protein